MVRLHRLALAEHLGVPYDDLKGVLVRHKCDNPRCIAPAHLEIGSAADNSSDMVQRGRSLRGAKHPGAKLNPAQVLDIRSRFVPASGRGCRKSNARLLAKEFGVSSVQIRNIGHRRQYASV